ncbi:cell division cycle-related protein [Elasticomyces elasticus]|nr:cell division cycle-related protein [Elasticomyces elasticus]
MLSRWVQSAALQEVYDDQASLRPPESVADLVMIGDRGGESEDSDVDLESKITMLIFENAKKKSISGDRDAAERMMLKCLSRLTGAGGRERSTKHTDGQPLYIHVLTSLYVLYTEQMRWPDAESILVKRMQLQERLMPQYPSLPVADTFDLAQLLFKQDKIAESELHARKALKEFRKHSDDRGAAKCLDLIIAICAKEDRDDDAEAYKALKVRILGMDLQEGGNAASHEAEQGLSRTIGHSATTTLGGSSSSVNVKADIGAPSRPLVVESKSSIEAVQANEQITGDARTEITAKPQQLISDVSALHGPAGSKGHIPLCERVVASDFGSIEDEANRAETVQASASRERMPQAPQLIPRKELKPRTPSASIPPLKSILKPKQEASARYSGVDVSKTRLHGEGKTPEPASALWECTEWLHVRALYDYFPEKDDMEALAFVAGDIILVVSQLESGWWDGVINGVRGWFPSNYTEFVDPQDDPGHTWATCAMNAANVANSASASIRGKKSADDNEPQNVVGASHGTSSAVETGKHKTNESVSSGTGTIIDWPVSRPSDRPTPHYRQKVVVVGDNAVGEDPVLQAVLQDLLQVGITEGQIKENADFIKSFLEQKKATAAAEAGKKDGASRAPPPPPPPPTTNLATHFLFNQKQKRSGFRALFKKT